MKNKKYFRSLKYNKSAAFKAGMISILEAHNRSFLMYYKFQVKN